MPLPMPNTSTLPTSTVITAKLVKSMRWPSTRGVTKTRLGEVHDEKEGVHGSDLPQRIGIHTQIEDADHDNQQVGGDAAYRRNGAA